MNTVCGDYNGTLIDCRPRLKEHNIAFGIKSAIIVSCLIVKPDGRSYCTATHRAARIGSDECVNTLQFADKKDGSQRADFYQHARRESASRRQQQRFVIAVAEPIIRYTSSLKQL